jgi:hypothetical protein
MVRNWAKHYRVRIREAYLNHLLKQFSRLTVVDYSCNMPRVYEARPVSIEASVQDHGKTLKLFVTRL